MVRVLAPSVTPYAPEHRMNFRPSSSTTPLRHIALVALLAASIVSPASAQFGRNSTNRSPIGVQWLGHAAFEITSPGGTKILIDPFLSANPSTPDSLKRLARYRPDAILVSRETIGTAPFTRGRPTSGRNSLRSRS